MVRGRTIVNAIIGAVIGVVLSFIPFSTVLGGAAAGFLEGPDERAGAIAGALAGVMTFLPIAGVMFLVFGFLGLGLGVGFPFEGVALVSIMIVGMALFVLFYTVGLSLLGGYLGSYLAREYPGHRRRTRETVGFAAESERSSPSTDVASMRDREAERDRSRTTDLEGDRHSDRERDRERDR